MTRIPALVALLVAAACVSAAHVSGASAYTNAGTTTYVPLGDGIAMERTELELVVPSTNTLPWAFVEGKVDNPVDGYPVIIQIHANGGEPVRFAQVDLSEDGTYEYRMRALSIDDGVAVRALDGAYDVTVFKVVHLDGALRA